MPSIDERVVSMAFENAKFEAGVAQTMRSLSKLDVAIQQVGQKNSLGDIEKAANKVTLEQPVRALDKLKARFSRAGDGAAEGMNEIERAGNKVTLEQPIRALNKVRTETAQVGNQAADGFNEIERASGRVSLQGLNSAMDSVTAKFSTMQAAASVAMGGIAQQAVTKGGAFAKSFSFGPIQQGFDEYQTNLGSIQTIMANTEGQRISGLGETNKHLQELNTYSDQTIYNFSQMAKNIGTFTAAGVDLDTSTKSIKGIANLAALSGSNSQQASTAMYQLSQAIASGKVGLQDWNSVVNAGMGGRKFQNSLIQTAVAMGQIPKEAVKIDKATGKATINGESFRESIMAKPGQKSWLTSEVLTGSLEQFTGDMSNAQLKAKGFTDEQIKSIQATAKSAKNAATQVKTLPQVFDVAKEAIGSGWAITFQNIFGDFKESKKLFTGVSQTLNGFIADQAKARNKMLGDWKKLGGRDELIGGIKAGFQALLAIMKPVGQAFRDIFPRKTGQDLFEMTKSFANFMRALKPGPQVIDGIRRTARGFFAVMHIGWSIVKGIVGVIGDLFGVLGKGSGGFLNFTGSIGDVLVAIDNALTKGGLLTSFFDGLSAVLQAPLKLLSSLAGVIFGLFDGADSGGADKVKGGIDKVHGAAKPLAGVLDTLKNAWAGVVRIFERAKDFVSPWLDKIGEQFSNLGDAISKAFEGGNFDHIMTALQTGFIGGIFIALKRAITGGSTELTGALSGLKDVMGGLTGNLQAMQQRVKAQILVQIAIAIGILAAATVVLASINADDLARALTAMAVGLGELMGAMKLMTAGLGKSGIAMMPIIAASLTGLAFAMILLGGAMKIFATMSWEDIAKGLVGVGGGIAAMSVGMKLMGGGPMMIAQAGALVILSLAMLALGAAVKQFASLDWESLGRGIAGVLGTLVAAMLPMAAAGPELAAGALAIVPIAIGLGMMAGAVKAFAGMDWEELARGIAGAAVGLVAIGAALWAIPPHAAILGASLIPVAIGLNGVASAVKIFASMSVGELAKGIIAMGAALLTLAVGLTAMIVSLPGAAALLVAAGALAILAPTLAFLGTLKWSTILKGLGAVALTLGVLAIAGMIAGPGLIALGIALLPLGLAFTLVAAAAYLFASALSKLASDGMKGVGILIAAITAFVAVLPKIIIDFVKGLVGIVGEVAKLAPKVVDAMVKIIGALIEAVIRLTPRWATAVGYFFDALLQMVIRDSPKYFQAGFTLLRNFLRAFDEHMPEIVSRGAAIIAKFWIGLAKKMPTLTAAGAKLIVAFLNGIANHVGEVVRAGANLVIKLANAVFPVIRKIGSFGPRAIASFIRGLEDGLHDLIEAGRDLIVNTLDGISSKFNDVANAATRFVTRFFKAFGNKENTEKMVRGGLECAVNILHGVRDGIKSKDNLEEIVKASEEIGWAVVKGVGKGLVKLPYTLGKKLVDPVLGKVKVVKKGIKSKSPSKVFIDLGQSIVDGMDIGLSQNGGISRKLVDGVVQPVGKMVHDMQELLDIREAAMVFVDIGEGINNGLGIGLRGIPGVLDNGVTGPIAAMLRETKGLRAFGQFLGTEFKEGLTGGLFSRDDRTEAQKSIEGAFDALKTKITEGHKALRDQVKADQDKLSELLNDPKKNRRAIDRARAELAEDQKTLALSQFRSRSLMKQLEDEEAALVTLGTQYEETSKQLEKAKEIFNEYKQQYNQLPDLSALLDEAMSKEPDAMPTTHDAWVEYRKQQEEKAKEEQKKRNIDQVANYKAALQQQIAATATYMETLKKLREAGLDDATYEKLLKQGTAGQEFASQLLAKGKGGIEEINKLNAELAKTATTIADNAAKALYTAGEQAAVGLIAGLEKKQSEIKKMMEFIADTMIKSLKFRLGIRSPSRIFAEMGAFSAQGLVDGFKASQSLVGEAAASLGNTASTALSRALSDIQNGVDSDLTITPVLDLTQVEKDASQIKDLTNVTPITAAASYGQAASISTEQAAAQAAEVDSDSPRTIEFNFEQKNESPKALDDVEIYRQTKNQLSQVKDALGLVK